MPTLNELQDAWIEKKHRIDALSQEIAKIESEILVASKDADELVSGAEVTINGRSGFVNLVGAITIWTPQPTSEDPEPKPVYFKERKRSDLESRSLEIGGRDAQRRG